MPASQRTNPLCSPGCLAASVYFRDPDNNLLEFITMLPDPPRANLGVLS